MIWLLNPISSADCPYRGITQKTRFYTLQPIRTWFGIVVRKYNKVPACAIQSAIERSNHPWLVHQNGSQYL